MNSLNCYCNCRHTHTYLNSCFTRFSAGDVVMMRPWNSPEDVELLCQLLRLDPDRYFTLTPTDTNTGLCVCVGEGALFSL